VFSQSGSDFFTEFLPRHSPLRQISSQMSTSMPQLSTVKASKSSNPEVVATQLQALHKHLNNKSFKQQHNPTELKKSNQLLE